MLAINLLVRAPINVPEGIGMIRAAAERGDAEAALWRMLRITSAPYFVLGAQRDREPVPVRRKVW